MTSSLPASPRLATSFPFPPRWHGAPTAEHAATATKIRPAKLESIPCRPDGFVVDWQLGGDEGGRQ